jgi:hypothetical protein
MADIVLQKSLAELIDGRTMLAPLSWTSGAGPDGVAQNGPSIDRINFPGAGGGLAGGSAGELPRSLDVYVSFTATLGQGFTLALTWDVQDSADNLTFADLAGGQQVATVAATGPAGGGTVTGVARMVVASSDKPAGTPGIYIGGARRYVRLVLTPRLNRGATDTAIIAAVGVFGGFDFARQVQLGTISGTPVMADVTALGSDVAAEAVTLTSPYQMVDPPGFPTRPGFCGAQPASLQYPRTIPAGATVTTFACEASALNNVIGGIVFPSEDFSNPNNSQYLAMRLGG